MLKQAIKFVIPYLPVQTWLGPGAGIAERAKPNLSATLCECSSSKYWFKRYYTTGNQLIQDIYKLLALSLIEEKEGNRGTRQKE